MAGEPNEPACDSPAIRPKLAQASSWCLRTKQIDIQHQEELDINNISPDTMVMLQIEAACSFFQYASLEHLRKVCTLVKIVQQFVNG